MAKIVCIENGYIIGVGINQSESGGVSDEYYAQISNLLRNRPEAEPSYQYMLNAETLEWDLVKDEPSEDVDDSEKAEAYDIIVSGIQSKKTPKPLEIAKKIKELVEKYYKG